jgi:hypothetical protein
MLFFKTPTLGSTSGGMKELRMKTALFSSISFHQSTMATIPSLPLSTHHGASSLYYDDTFSCFSSSSSTNSSATTVMASNTRMAVRRRSPVSFAT